jgi:hypothetical protein
MAFGNAGSPAVTVGGAGNAGRAGSAGNGGRAGTTGAHVPAADLDPDLKFDWKETLPGMGTCQAGSYTGTFTCMYGDLPVSGPITLVFTKSADGEFLDLSHGELMGTAMDFIGFSCTLDGRLDCATLTFQASAENGMYGFGDPSVLPFGMFDGMLTGMLDTQTLTLSGDWDLGTTGDTQRCTGPWTAQLTP